MPILFSIIVPTHNRPNLLRELIQAIANQSLSGQEFELIIIPSPNDTSASLLQEMREKYPWLRPEFPPNDPYQGKSASYKRNYGAKLALGEWLAFTDDDCTPDENWLNKALERIQSNEIFQAIEGHVNIPYEGKETLTLKGMKRLQRQGGYQTCNMFYRRDEFVKVKGFDLAFPYYLEDTDMAWTFLEAGYKIIYEPAAIVSHPPLDPDPWKLITMASKSGQQLRLKAKHPENYERYGMTPMRKSQVLYFILGLTLVLTPLFQLQLFLGLLILMFALVSAHMIKMYWGLSFSLKELVLVAFLTPLVPWICVYQLIKTVLGPKEFWRNPEKISSI